MKTYNVHEVAELLHVNPESVRRWVRTGRLKGDYDGCRRHGFTISESDLLDFMDSKPKYSANKKDRDIERQAKLNGLYAELETYVQHRDFIDARIKHIEREIKRLTKGKES